MRQSDAPGHHRRQHGGWLPAVGDVVCVHVDGPHRYFARVINAKSNIDGYPRCLVQPLRSSRENMRDTHRSKLEPAIATFEGYICMRCRKGNR